MAMKTKDNAIYTAVLLQEPQLTKNNLTKQPKYDATTKETEPFRCTTTPSWSNISNFIVGALWGALASHFGFSIQEKVSLSIVQFSLAWSFVTSISAYSIFWLKSLTTNTQQEQPWQEYCFALGVFLGFCLACTVTDILLGMPWTSIALTIALAGVWATVMLACAYRMVQEDDVEEEEEMTKKSLVLTIV